MLAKYMRTECINHRYVYDEPMQVRLRVFDASLEAVAMAVAMSRRFHATVTHQ